jgi:hypothetical protein
MQAKFNPDAINEQFKAVMDDASFEATIRSVEQMKACEIFGDECDNPDRDVLHIRVEVLDGEMFYETYSLPKSAGSFKRDNFKLGQFMRKYGTAPVEGMKIQTKVNAEGYYRIAV